MNAKHVLIAFVFFCCSLFGWGKSHLEKRRIERELKPYIQEKKTRDSLGYIGGLVFEGVIDAFQGNYKKIFDTVVQEADRSGELYFKMAALSLRWESANFQSQNSRRAALISGGVLIVALTIVATKKPGDPKGKN